MRGFLTIAGLAVSAAAVLAPGGADAAAVWTIVSSPNPSPTQSYLFDVACPAAADCWAVGVSGATPGERTLIEHGTTAGWAVVESPNASAAGDNQLTGIACANSVDCWAVGNIQDRRIAGGSPQTLTEHYTGGRWTIVKSPTPSGEAGLLLGAACVSSGDCWAVGESLATSRPGVAAAGELIEHNPGAGWGIVASPNSFTDSFLSRISCSPTGDCWAVGGPQTRSAGPPVFEHLTPTGWVAVAGPEAGAGRNNSLHGVNCRAADDCWAAGTSSIPPSTGGRALAEHFDGASWSVVATPTRPEQTHLGGVACLSSGDCWMVGGSGAATLVVRFTRDGASAVPSPSPTAGPRNSLNSVACDPTGDCWAVGSAGNGGTSVGTTSTTGQTLIERSLRSAAEGAVTCGAGSAGMLNPAQSAFGTSPVTPSCAFGSTSSVAKNAAGAMAIVLLGAFPALLFNRTYEENHERIVDWWGRRASWTKRVRQRTGVVRTSRRAVAAYAAVVVCGGLLGSLLDPSFGFDLATVALGLGIALALVADTGVLALSASLYGARRGAALSWSLRALPSALVVAAAGVLVSRLTGVLPGYLYGVIAGIVFARPLVSREAGPLVAMSSAAGLVVSLAAWLLWVPVSSAAATPGAGFAWALLENFLVAVFVTGLVGLVIGLVPLRFLPGERLAAWHRGVWAAAFAVTAFALLEIMVQPQATAGQEGARPLWTTLGLFAAFALGSVLFWAYFRLRPSASERSAAGDSTGATLTENV